MASTTSNTVSVLNETEHVSSRITREGRKITYKLRVIQRPERARACGQGAKSSSDRRPVDPPPVVDLQVLEGDELRDITFTYNAHFFLFATLEEARQKVQGRVPVAASNKPVLTGSPAAGMAYLDRPSPAGYFIFPDLSVRHEGHFRLCFTLYEDTKDPRDQDIGVDPSELGPAVHGRCEVKSLPFHVYSAKKFPGLTESTALSRTVADQGCRVRIRRDVRMRRRTDKPQKDWDEGDDEDVSRQSPTPEVFSRQAPPVTPIKREESIKRERSVSNTSNVPYQQLHQAPPRGSAQDMHLQGSRPYPTQVEMSHPQTSMAPQPNDPAQLSHPTQFQAAQQQTHITPPSYHQAHIAPFTPTYQSQFLPQSQMPPYQPPQYGYAQPPAPQSTQHVPFGNIAHPVFDPQVSQMRQQSMDYGSSAQSYQRDMSQQGIPTAGLMPPDNFPLSNATALPPLQMNSMKTDNTYERAVASPAEFSTMSARPLASAKRTFGSTFSMQHVNEPLRGGARPDPMAEASQEASDGSDDDAEMQMLRMNYRRADGSKVSRAWPQSAI